MLGISEYLGMKHSRGRLVALVFTLLLFGPLGMAGAQEDSESLEEHRAGHEWDAWKKIALPAGFLAFMIGVALMLLIYFAMASRLTG
ncbi:MAG: hypothetical protein JRE43_11480, partial [Deltaproteobacteria bacterium]|nr:hypothetical protein [Deltaproteobacteria bacterium]